MLVLLLDKSFYNFTSSNHECLSINYRMFSMKQFQVLFLGYIEQSTNVLLGLSVSSINYSCFMRLFNKYMSHWGTPECFPDSLKWNFFDIIGTILSQMLDHFPREFTYFLFSKPCRFVCFWFEIVWEFNTKSSGSLWIAYLAIEKLWGLKELFPTHTNPFDYTFCSKQWMHCLVIKFEPLIISSI